MRLHLSSADESMLDGSSGPAAAFAMRILVDMAAVMGAERLIDVTRAHVDGCLYHGRAGLDFAERLVADRARVAVPTTLNVSSLDLLHPERSRSDPETAANARRQMDCYVAMGCRPTWTCAPYQLADRPRLGEHVAWAESNAIVFANSVLGARTNRYGDFLDICCAITGRAPLAGMHREENRLAGIVFRLAGIPDRLLEQDLLYPVLGHLIGREAGSTVPAIVGLHPDTSEDQLKALGAAAASSGSVAMFHAVGVTPEAPTLEVALGGGARRREVAVTVEMLATARDELTTRSTGHLAAVSLGTPHFSIAEFADLVRRLDGFRAAAGVELFVNTSRDVLSEVQGRGWLRALDGAGVRIVTDTCTYITPIIDRPGGLVMTNSAKWAWYAPANIGVEVALGSLEECLRSAELGGVWRDPELWSDD